MRRASILASVVAGLCLIGAVALAADEDEEAYLSECAGCHGPDGSGTEWAPSILDEGAAGADFMMRTGRMPLDRPTDPIERGAPQLDEEQIRRIVDHVATFEGGTPVPDPQPVAGDLATGADLYLLNCAACHGSTGVGAALVGSRNAPDVLRADAIEIAEAIRSGPGPMPAYPEALVDQHELDSIVRYVLHLDERTSVGGWSLGRWGPVAEGAVAWLIGVVVVVWAAVWIEGQTRPVDAAGEGEA